VGKMWERIFKTPLKKVILKNGNIEKSRISGIKHCMAFKRSGVRLPSAPLDFSRVLKISSF